MSLTKAEVRAAFREAAARSYAHVPSAEEIDHVFSESFYRRMDALIEEERRGSWRLMSRQRRRTLVVAAILMAALLLTACSPALREAVTEFVVSIYERFVDYGTKTELHAELETIYVLDPVPEGFELVSQTKHSTYYTETVYHDEDGDILVLSQATFEDINGILDNEQGETLLIGEGNISILVYSSEMFTSVSWTVDGYYMKLLYYGQIDCSELTSLAATLSPLE